MAARHTIAALSDLPPNTGRAFAVDGRRIAVFNAGGRIFAIDDTCTHDHASLAEGSVEGTTVVCPWHGAEFDLTCGRVLCPPATENVRTYPVFVDGGKIEVEV